MTLTQVSTGGIKNATIKNEDIEADAIQLTKLQNMATNHILGRSTTGTGNPEVLSAAQARTILNIESGANAVTVTNTGDNRVLTATGTANQFNGESTLTYNGSSLKIGDSSFSNVNSDAQNLVIGTESSGSNRGLSIITNSNNNAHLFFGDQDSGTQGGFRYQNSVDNLQGYSGGSAPFNLKSNALGLHENYPEAHSITIRGASQNDVPLLVIRKHTDGDTNHDEEIGRIKFKSNDANVDSGNSVSRVEMRAVHVNAAGAAKLEFYTVPNFTTNPIKRMTLNQEGRLCIGTDDAVAKLNVVNSSSDTTATGTNALAGYISVSNTNTTNNNFTGIVMGDRTDSQDFIGAMLTQITDHTQNYGNLVFYTNGSGGRTEKLRIKQDGGITFNGDTATANTLDDYEEGTYTANLYRTSSNVTFARRKGRYIRIGNMCFVWFDVQTSSNNSSGSGAWRISLPFTFANNSSGTSGLDNAGHGAPSFRDMSFFTREQGYRTSSYINGDYIELRYINNSDQEQNMIENGGAGRVTGQAWGYLSQA